MLHKTLVRFASVVWTLQALYLCFRRIVTRHEINQKRMDLNSVNCVQAAYLRGHGNIIIQEIIVWCIIVCFVFIATNILQWDSITSWDGTNVIEECGLPILPLDGVSELLGLRCLRQCLGVGLKLLMRLIAPYEIADLLDRKWFEVRLSAKA